jgi:hypothetical protein
MVLVWVGIAIGVLLTIILIIKLVKTHPHDAVKNEDKCERCGSKIIGVKCPKCNKVKKFDV